MACDCEAMLDARFRLLAQFIEGTGALGDPAAIDATIAEAGTGGTIVLAPGTTLVIDRTMALLPGQTLIGYGATIERIAQVFTTTTTTITPDVTTSFDVATGTGANFEVGQTIALYNGTDVGYHDYTALLISSIDDDTITVSLPISTQSGNPLTGTTTVALTFPSVTTSDANTIKGVTFDGNSSNWLYYHWTTTVEVRGAGVTGNHTVEGCTFKNAPGEGIAESGSPYTMTGNVYAHNRFLNINGNGIHLSYSDGTNIHDNTFTNTNLQGPTVQHDGGAVTLSNVVSNANIHHNRMENGRSGVGQIDSIDNSQLTIDANVMRNMRAFFIESATFNQELYDLVISNNQFINDDPPNSSGSLIRVRASSNSAAYQHFRTVITGNKFFNAALYATNLTNAVIADNTFDTSISYEGEAGEIVHLEGLSNGAVDNLAVRKTYLASDMCTTMVALLDMTNTSVSNVATENGYIGIDIRGTNSGLSINTPNVSTPYYYGILSRGENTALSILGPTVVMDANVNAGSAQGIALVGGDTTVRGANVSMAAGYCGFRINGSANVVAQNNTVIASSTGKTIRIESGSTGYVVSENQVNFAIVDTAGVGVRVANNDIIA